MNSNIKGSLLQLIFRTAHDLQEYESLYSRYGGRKTGSFRDAVKHLTEIGLLLIDVDIPDTEAVEAEYSIICGDLSFLRSSIDGGKMDGADVVADWVDQDTGMLYMAAAEESKHVNNPDLEKPYTDTDETVTCGIDADMADALTAGLAVFKALNQADDFIGQMRRLADRIKKNRNATKAERQEPAAYMEACGEVASCMESLKASFVPLSGEYPAALKKIQEFLKCVEKDINARRPAGREEKVAVNSFADVMRLYLNAIKEQDSETAEIIKSSIGHNAPARFPE